MESSLKRVRNMTCTCSYILYLYNVHVHHCTNSVAFSDVVYKHENALYLGPQPIPPAPFDPDHCRHEIADFYRHHIRPPGEPILIPLLQNTHSISHHCPRYLSLSLGPRLSLLVHNNSTYGSKVRCHGLFFMYRSSSCIIVTSC